MFILVWNRDPVPAFTTQKGASRVPAQNLITGSGWYGVMIDQLGLEGEFICKSALVAIVLTVITGALLVVLLML